MQLAEFARSIDPEKLSSLKKIKLEMLLKLVDDYNTGLTIPELSHKYGVSKAAISRVFKLAGLQPQRKDGLFQKREITKEVKDAIAADYRCGKTIYEIASKHKLGHMAVAKILENKRIRKRQRHKFNRESFFKATRHTAAGKKLLSLIDQKRLCIGYIKGVTQIKLADKWDVSLATVRKILHKNRVTTKRAISDNILTKICQEYKNGFCTAYDLAAIYGIHVNVVKYWLAKKGFDPHTQEGSKMKNNVIGLPTASPGTPAGAMRKKMRELADRAAEALERIFDDPAAEHRDIIAATKFVYERAYGKPKEEESDEKTHLTGKDKILAEMSPALKKELFKNGTSNDD